LQHAGFIIKNQLGAFLCTASGTQSREQNQNVKTMTDGLILVLSSQSPRLQNTLNSTTNTG